MERGSVVYKQFPSLFNLSECQEEEKEKDEEVHIETRQDKVADDGHAKIADDGHAKINQDSISNTSDKLIFRSLFKNIKI